MLRPAWCLAHGLTSVFNYKYDPPHDSRFLILVCMLWLHRIMITLIICNMAKVLLYFVATIRCLILSYTGYLDN